ncbi:hypothetical protein M9H77_16881 [Catharanthus roseus]|uniref:Uncharacterized protein n=1 Tax=Catharanthus roseus TaxID=4058 RepID=A0ACC0B3E6_CATRO|nr:hypothetical protein M9H77_16881 [Catharanthus roseus]
MSKVIYKTDAPRLLKLVIHQRDSNMKMAIGDITNNLDGGLNPYCSSQSFLLKWAKLICDNYFMQNEAHGPQASSSFCSKFAHTCGVIIGGPAGPGDHYSYLNPINGNCCKVVKRIGKLDGRCFKYVAIFNEIKNICGP